MAKTEEFIATGRRKNSVARIRMTAGSGKIDVNGRNFEDYFPTSPLQNTVLQPLQTAKVVNAYDLSVNATGGGVTGQAGAVRLAIARALLQVDGALRATLKAEGLLRRDPRMKERKNPDNPARANASNSRSANRCRGGCLQPLSKGTARGDTRHYIILALPSQESALMAGLLPADAPTLAAERLTAELSISRRGQPLQPV